jgi:hypothetical protein
MSEAEAWYVVKQMDGHCAIVKAVEAGRMEAEDTVNHQRWGPFASESEAIARRVGLIRAGKCQPN